MVIVCTIESNDTFLTWWEDALNSSLEEDLRIGAVVLVVSKVSKDFDRLNERDLSDGNENKSYAPSIVSVDDKALLADSFETNVVQESSNKEVRMNDAIGALQSGFSSFGSVLSFVVYFSERRRRIISSCWLMISS
jgi:hypothetical protein